MSYRVDNILANYRKMTDGELLDLADQQDQLTPDACAALSTELASRGLTPQAVSEAVAESPVLSPSEPPAYEGPDYLRVGVFGAQPPPPSSDLVVVFSAQSEAEAQAAQASLRDNGIDSELQIVVLVAENKSEDALRIISEKFDQDPDADDESHDSAG